METSVSLIVTGSRRARDGSNHTPQGLDSVGGTVVDLTTDSGVEDDDVVDLTEQVCVFAMVMITSLMFLVFFPLLHHFVYGGFSMCILLS